MWYVVILIGVLVVSSLFSPSLAASPLGNNVTDYCGTYEAVGATNPAKEPAGRSRDYTARSRGRE